MTPTTGDPARSGRVERLLADTYRIADEILYPAAGDVDHSGTVPDSHWRELADAGLYGLVTGDPPLELTTVLEIGEVLASGCLPTAFTWLQHHGVVISLSGTDNDTLRDRYLDATVAGRVRAGVAYAGVVPTPPRMTAARTEGGWILDGYAPFVSGWGIVHILQISARDVQTDDVIAAIVDVTQPVPGIAVTPTHLSVCNATRTVFLRVEGVRVDDADIVSRVSLEQFFATQITGLRINGILPFGILRRATALLERGSEVKAARTLRERAGEVRARLDNALGAGDPGPMIDARADAARLAVDAASALVSADGGRALLSGNDAQRLARESMFTLVAASRPQVKDLLVQQFSGS
ncbi:acyl-CoA/acyl-ACP dehydrogenase [Gordonia polyisoprenivorans]|uniref:acyl-CoA dehydrogenase family protein n=1 Tax=Gordonia polyisoprenivorans TaxID=84595 RepID=UPI0022345E63|nr:acyl-CoA/acyl-ACP dehydrogenase [Gordonia polyisoprenivorans]